MGSMDSRSRFAGGRWLAHLLTGSVSTVRTSLKTRWSAVHQRWREIESPGPLRVTVVNLSRSVQRRLISRADARAWTSGLW